MFAPNVSLVLTQGVEAVLLSAPIAGGITQLYFFGSSAQLQYGNRNPRIQVSSAGVTDASVIQRHALVSHNIW